MGEGLGERDTASPRRACTRRSILASRALISRAKSQRKTRETTFVLQYELKKIEILLEICERKQK